MNEAELKAYLKNNYPFENESCEWKDFKSLKHSFAGNAGDDIISYISAISNMEGGHLVIGTEDGTHNIMGIQDFHNHTAQNIKLRVVNKCSNLDSDNFSIEEFTTSDTEKTVWVFHIPKHLARQPVIAHSKAWQRIEDSLIEIRKERYDLIIKEPLQLDEDWSAQIIPDATIDDLDTDALLVAKEKFKEKSSKEKYYDKIDEWNVPTFLDKAKITINGKITNTAILLLGKEESVHYISPSISEITWKLEAEEKAYEHFSSPLLLSTTKVLEKIRNIKYKFFPDNELLATTVDKYDTRTILEAMHNCIAHQDYSLNSRIIVTEKVDKLIFSNAGNFFEGNPDDYFTGDKTPERYRNPWLVKAMVNLGMIDTMGYGIHTMYISQRKRFFPLPDFDFSQTQRVILKVYGHSIDMNYSKLLIEKKDLPLSQVVLLDRVQKKLPLTKEGALLLKKNNLIEGRRPNYILSFEMALHPDAKTDYIKQRGFKDIYYKDLILNYIDKNKFATKKDIDKLLLDTLPSILSEKQKENKIRNIVYAMSKRDKSITNKGTIRYPEWIRTK